jgi:hypothetical protein
MICALIGFFPAIARRRFETCHPHQLPPAADVHATAPSKQENAPSETGERCRNVRRAIPA